MNEYLIDPPTGIDSVLDSAIEPTYFEIRMPDVSEYDALERLWQADELDSKYKAENELYHVLKEHADDCTGTHYWLNSEGDPVYCCEWCMSMVTELMGNTRFYTEKIGRAA